MILSAGMAGREVTMLPHLLVARSTLGFSRLDLARFARFNCQLARLFRSVRRNR
jgi:hypothetical protein